MSVPNSWRVERLTASECTKYQDQLADIFVNAFSGPPHNAALNQLRDDFFHDFPHRRLHMGFRCVAARHSSDGFVGFAYGYQSTAGQRIYRRVHETFSAEQRTTWLDSAFYLAEMVVWRTWQGRGVGGALHDALLNHVSQRVALLTTLDVQGSRALRLYEGRGWQTLARNVYFSRTERDYRIMGKRLGNEQ